MLIFTRFFSRRGVPKSILSDNATYFTSEETQNFASSRNVTWTFNPPAAPWWGGVYERIVRSVKRCLKKILGKSKITYEELQTILYDIEAVLNNRPLTFTYENPEDTVLTPNHLLYGRRLDLESNGNYMDYVDDDMNIRYKHITNLLKTFVNRWSHEYLTELREHHKVRGRAVYHTCNVGDVVLIYEENVPRIRYKVGVIQNFKQSRDGVRRIANVRYVMNGRKMTIQRPINKLYRIKYRQHEQDEIKVAFVDERNVTTN